MRRHSTEFGVARAALVALSLGSAACYTAFSPAVIRGEIARQTGKDPQGVFELSLGKPTMALAKAVLGAGAPDGPLPLAGVSAFELATYDVPGNAGDLDFTRMPLYGWEPVVKFREGPKSAFVLVRYSDEYIGDLVVVAGGGDQVVYARIKGRLSRDLPEALGRAVQSEGPDAIEHELMSLSE
jgi:hypothetical protein